MQDINYINHLNAVLEQFAKDERLNPTHISMYIALFRFWNYLHFPETFHVNREEIMKLSKIGSKSTYHRVVRELSHWEYIVYMPSKNPFKGSSVKMFKFETSSKPPRVHYNPKSNTSSKQALVSKNKRNKTIINKINIEKGRKPKDEKDVLEFFKKEKSTETEARTFFNHYQSVGWKLGKVPIQDWHALAKKWMLNSKSFAAEKEKQNLMTQSQNKDKHKATDHLHTNRDKNYNQPL
ncbi:conserved hypothetical protein [Formosa agariphila KMM 3901]|uniref:Uncharacterized protein n=1 Tax=Formosa agariphila (strain DSM 15362 / KCTC 12365 / LMG 23005 / KMM 3901 / M-2Alg 35-1) TaxID=1347342 RepID=T2KPC7_FORAG|nr:hypothetical protein [Formosa agariphila]CDF80318.1 conserved hypothetical protein [Formosa agariphila KMM 3901]